MGSIPYYESVDLIDALHPQTIMAFALNDKTLDVGHGAPLRLRVERQLGYKHAKYVMEIEAVHELTSRSEEHTSELQSLMRISYAVFCLKKKQKQNINNKNINT